MISILITYYNQENYVSRSLNSVFSQHLKSDFEVLVGDDGSDDDTVRIVQEYQRKYPNKIKLFIQPRNKNKDYLSVERATKNRINLLNNAQGNYICFLDGDDEYCNFTFMQTAIDKLNTNDKLSGVTFNYITIKKDGQKEFHKKMVDDDFISLKDYAKNLYIHVGAMIFRKPNNVELNKINRLKCFDDNDITYFFLNRNKFFYIDLDVYNYYFNDNSICNNTTELEMILLNAIDYYIIKKMINKNHFTLFIRYFDQIKKVFLHRKELQNEKYQKYKVLCVKNSFIFKLLSWNKFNTIEKKILELKFILTTIILKILKK